MNASVQRGKAIACGGNLSGIAGEDAAYTSMIDTLPKTDCRELSPELMFAGAYAASFLQAMREAARKMEIPDANFSVVIEVEVLFRQKFKVDVRARLPAVERNDAESILAHAHSICPYSQAIEGNADVTFGLI